MNQLPNLSTQSSDTNVCASVYPILLQNFIATVKACVKADACVVWIMFGHILISCQICLKHFIEVLLHRFETESQSTMFMITYVFLCVVSINKNIKRRITCKPCIYMTT